MQVSSLTAAGTIREQNQDSIFINKEARLVLLADGTGPDGQQSTREVLPQIATEIIAHAHVFSGTEAPERLARALIFAEQAVEEHFPRSIAGIAALWVHRGQIALAWKGSCRIFTGHSFVGTPHPADPQLKTTSLKVCGNERLILLSEGIVAALRDNYLQNLLNDVLKKHTPEKLQFFWNEAAVRYDGDDRSIVSLCLDKSDLTAGNPKELVLFSDFDWQFSFPLWLPAALSAFLSLVGLFVARKAYNLVKPHFPQLRGGLGQLARLQQNFEKSWFK